MKNKFRVMTLPDVDGVVTRQYIEAASCSRDMCMYRRILEPVKK